MLRGPGGNGSITAKAAAVCAIVSIAIAALAYGVGKLLPYTYQSYGLIRVALPSTQGIIDPVVTAANDTASQYAQLASSQPVQRLTASKLGVSAGSLDGKISGSTVGAQNLIQVTVTARSSATATARAAAASASLQEYISGLDAQAGAQYIDEVQSGLVRTNQNLIRLQARLANDRPAARSSDILLIQTLSLQRDQLLGEIARDAASNRPALQLVDSATSASVVTPQPTLYAVVAFVVALIVSGRAAFVLSRRRLR